MTTATDPATHATPVTAGDLAQRAASSLDTFEMPDCVGRTDGRGNDAYVIADRSQLSRLLRTAHPTAPQMRVEHGWWHYDLPAAGLQVGGEGLDDLAANAINALRNKVRDLDPAGESGDALVWIVLTSTNDELRSWLHIPAS